MSTESAGGLRQPRSAAWLMLCMMALAWFATMPVRPLLDPDEGRYAEIPREMWVSGDWVTPRLNGLKYFEKPPLQYWATATAYSAFGLSEWTARLWAVGLGFACLPLVFGWTLQIYGRAAAWAATTALAANPYFELLAHLNLLDSGFAFWLAAAVFAFTLAMTAEPGCAAERRWMLLTWAAAALAVLSKGIVVFVLAGATLVAYTLLERDRRTWRRLYPLFGVPLFALISVPWFVAVSRQNPAFLQFFFVHEHFARFLTTVHQRAEPWWYFGALLLIAALPWLPALWPASRAAWFETSGKYQFKPLKFLLLFSVVTLVFFSASGSKLAPYILPMMPALAAAVGVHMNSRMSFHRRVSSWSAALIVFLGGGLLVYASHRFGFVAHAAVAWIIGAVAAALAGVLAVRRLAAANVSRVAAAACVSAILAWQCLLCAYSELPIRSAYAMLMFIKPQIGPHTQLYSLGQYRETLSPYLQRTMTLVEFQGELAFGLSEEPAAGLTAAQFLERWNAAPDAVAFLDPLTFDTWRKRGLRGRIIGGDDDTLAVSKR